DFFKNLNDLNLFWIMPFFSDLSFAVHAKQQKGVFKNLLNIFTKANHNNIEDDLIDEKIDGLAYKRKFFLKLYVHFLKNFDSNIYLQNLVTTLNYFGVDEMKKFQFS